MGEAGRVLVGPSCQDWYMSSESLLGRVEGLGTTVSALLAVDLTALPDAALVEAVKALRPVV